MADVVLPGRKGSNERNAFMQPINDKVNSYLASQGIEGTSGSNDIVINSQGGDVNIGDEAMNRFKPQALKLTANNGTAHYRCLSVPFTRITGIRMFLVTKSHASSVSAVVPLVPSLRLMYKVRSEI